MNDGERAEFLREVAPQLSGAILLRVQDGVSPGGWLIEKVRQHMRRIEADGLQGSEAIAACVALLLAEQAKEVHGAIMARAAALDARHVAAQAVPEAPGS